MRYLDNLKISIKILLIIGLMSATTIFVTLMLSQRLVQADDQYSRLLANDVPYRIENIRFRMNVQQMLYDGYKILSYDGSSEQAKASEKSYNTAKNDAQGRLNKLLTADTFNTDFYQKIQQGLNSLTSITDKAVAAGLKNENEAARNFLAKADELAGKTSEELLAFNNQVIKTMSQKAAGLNSDTMSSVRLGYILGFSGLAIAAALGLWISVKKISAPINKLSETMRRLSSGDLEVAIEGQDRKDEIGTMSQAVVGFKAAAVERLRLEADAAQARQQAEQERARREAEKLEESRQDQIMIETLAGSLARMADGDLSFQIEQVFAPKVERVRIDFNEAIKKLREVLQNINVNTDSLHSSASEIASASDDLARRTEQQAASLEETTAALNEITQTVKKTAEGAKHAREVVVSAKAEADSSNKIVTEAIVSMNEIEKSSHQITQIISVIDEIAFQTNLLALNAGVEAARAGEAGRGFAVVASEVRALAQRSAEAAKEIKGLISTSSNQVAQGVEHVTETGKALSKIVEQVQGINQIVSEIASSSQSQSAALQQVNVAVNQMDQMTQQNAAMVEETTAAAQSLDRQCNDLKHLVGQFQTAITGSAKRKSPALSHAAA